MYASEITLCLRHSTFWLDPTKLVEKYGFRSCIHPLHLYLKYILNSYHLLWASLVTEMVKNLPAMQETWVQSLDWEDPLEKGTAAHSSVLAFKIPWTERPGRLQFMGSQRVRHDWSDLAQIGVLRWEKKAFGSWKETCYEKHKSIANYSEKDPLSITELVRQSLSRGIRHFHQKERIV